MKKEFKMVAGWVMSVLGIQNFAKDDNGKLFLTAEQEQTLKEKYGEKFVEGFKADLSKMEVNGGTVDLTLSAEEKLELEASRIETKNLKAKIETLQAAEKDLKATIAKLENPSPKVTPHSSCSICSISTVGTQQVEGSPYMVPVATPCLPLKTLWRLGPC